MRLKTISQILFSLSMGADIGIILGLGYLAMSRNGTSVKETSLPTIIGVFALVLSWGLLLLSWQIDIHSDAEEVKQW